MTEAEPKIAFDTITGEGIVVDIEHFTLKEARDRCRENWWNNCAQDMKPCDLNASATCHRGTPCIIADKVRKGTLRWPPDNTSQP